MMKPDANNAVFLRKLSLLTSNLDSLELNRLKICLIDVKYHLKSKEHTQLT